MKTIYLSDQAFEEIAGAMEEKANGQHVLIDLLCGRFGLESEQVKAETNALQRLVSAAHELHGISTWRSNGVRTMPVGSMFTPPGEKT